MSLTVTAPQRTSRWWSLAGGVIILVAWHLAAKWMGPMMMATPFESLQAVPRLIASGHFLEHASASLMRIAIGVSIGCTIGFALGVLAGLSPQLRGLLEPLRWLLMAVPPVIVVVLAMLWFGLG